MCIRDRWGAILTDYFQNRDAVLTVEAVFSDQPRVFLVGTRVLRAYLCHAGALHQHGSAAVQCFGSGVPDGAGVGADYQSVLSAVGWQYWRNQVETFVQIDDYLAGQ